MLPYQNPQLDIEARLDDLISRMTLEELIMQTDQYHGGDLCVGRRTSDLSGGDPRSASVPRLRLVGARRDRRIP